MPTPKILNAGLAFFAEGAGPPLLLLHPVGLDHRCWDAVAARLAASRTVLRPDLPGHGRSPAAFDGATLEDYTDAVAQWVRALGCGPAAVVGLSFGGMIAQALAVRHRELVRALVVSGCPATFPDERAREAMTARGQQALAGGMEAVLAPTLERWFTPAFRAAGRDRPIAKQLLGVDPAAWAQAWQAISGLDLLARLGELRVPTLCIAGEADPAAPPAALAAIAETVPGARLTVLPGAPHMMQIECPEAYAAAVVEFLDRV